MESDDSLLDLSSGDFWSSTFGSSKSLAQDWLDTLNDTSLATGVYDFHYLTNSDSQNLLTVTKASVPEPTTLFLFATGLFALFRARRRTQ